MFYNFLALPTKIQSFFTEVLLNIGTVSEYELFMAKTSLGVWLEYLPHGEVILYIFSQVYKLPKLKPWLDYFQLILLFTSSGEYL